MEEQTRLIARSLNFPNASYRAVGLAEVLGLAAGVKPDEDEVLPATEDLIKAANEVFAAFGDEDALIGIHDSLIELLQEPQFQLLRFPPYLLVQALDEHPVLGGLDEEDRERGPIDEALRNKAIGDVIRPLVTPDFVAHVIFEFIFHLRDPETSSVDYIPIVWGLLMALDQREVGDNPLWVALFELTIKEAAAGEQALAEIVEKYRLPDASRTKNNEVFDEAFIEEFKNVLEKHPLLKEKMSQMLREQVAPALKAIQEGRIKLEVPLYAVIHGLVDFFGYGFKIVEETLAAGSDTGTASSKKLENLLFNIDNGFTQVLLRDIWERDYDVFVSSIREKLQSWLDAYQNSLGHDEDLDEEQERLASSVKTLINAVGGFVLDVERAILIALYLQSINYILQDKELVEKLNKESLETYAQDLEKAGRQAAAENVRKAVGKIKALNILDFAR